MPPGLQQTHPASDLLARKNDKNVSARRGRRTLTRWPRPFSVPVVEAADVELNGLGVSDALDRVVIGWNRQVAPDAGLSGPGPSPHSRKVLRKSGVGELAPNQETNGMLVHVDRPFCDGISPRVVWIIESKGDAAREFRGDTIGAAELSERVLDFRKTPQSPTSGCSLRPQTKPWA